MRGGARGSRSGGRGGARGGGRFGGVRERDSSSNADHKNSGTGTGSVVADANSAAGGWGESTPADVSGWGESTNLVPPVVEGWGETEPETSTLAEPESSVEPASTAPAVVINGKPSAQKPSPVPTPAPAASSVTSKSSRVPPGAKLSWAQVTRYVQCSLCDFAVDILHVLCNI